MGVAVGNIVGPYAFIESGKFSSAKSASEADECRSADLHDGYRRLYDLSNCRGQSNVLFELIQLDRHHPTSSPRFCHSE